MTKKQKKIEKEYLINLTLAHRAALEDGRMEEAEKLEK